jgi:arylsulfate sulfotransferase
MARAANPAAPRVSVKSSVSPGQPVGTAVTWTASSSGLKSPVYRYSVALGQGAPAVVRDFSATTTFTWAPLHEGTYILQITAKDGYSATATQQTETSFLIHSRVTGKDAVVSRTANPLVALYSAPACASGTMVVQFRAKVASAWQSTAPQPCVAGRSINVLVSGMRAASTYVLRDVVSGGTPSAELAFTTGKPEAGLKITKFTVKQAPTARADVASPVIFHSLNPNPSPAFANPIATDLSGNLVWYYDTLHSGLSAVWPVHSFPGGTVLLLGHDTHHKTGEDVLREINLAGNVVRETNIDALNAQLTRLGKESIYEFHHDALRLPNGYTGVLGSTQKKINGKDVMTDMVLVLDGNFQVVWTWDMYDHFTPPAKWPAFIVTCDITGPFLCGLPDKKAIDWSHGNGLAYSPADGDLNVSFRNIDLVIKVDYQNGKGSGKVVWKLGKGDDFTTASKDPYPWFSKQHNPVYVNATDIVIFDDSNNRCQNGAVKGCQSRGQVWRLDEKKHTATLLLNVQLGTFWQALGSAQGLPNGNFTFTGGYPAPKSPMLSREVEVSPNGTKVYELDTTVPEYRSYRLTALS